MSTTKSISGTLYIIPEVQEYDWGDNVSDLLIRTAEDLDGTFQSINVIGPASTVNFNNGKNIYVTLNTDTTLTLTNPRGGRPAVFWIYQMATYTITWPSNIVWPGGVRPTLNLGSGNYIVTLLYNTIRLEYAGEYGTLRYS